MVLKKRVSKQKRGLQVLTNSQIFEVASEIFEKHGSCCVYFEKTNDRDMTVTISRTPKDGLRPS